MSSKKFRKTPRHGTVASLLQDLLVRVLSEGFFLRREEPLTFRDSEPEPDLSVVAGIRSDYHVAHPQTAALVVEVSVNSVDEDRAKIALYAEAEVGEYWIVLPLEKAVEVYRHPEAGRYREMRVFVGDEVLACGTVAGGRVELAVLFAGL